MAETHRVVYTVEKNSAGFGSIYNPAPAVRDFLTSILVAVEGNYDPPRDDNKIPVLDLPEHFFAIVGLKSQPPVEFYPLQKEGDNRFLFEVCTRGKDDAARQRLEEAIGRLAPYANGWHDQQAYLETKYQAADHETPPPPSPPLPQV
jgi:hypothetical protein